MKFHSSHLLYLLIIIIFIIIGNISPLKLIKELQMCNVAVIYQIRMFLAIF